MKPQHHLDAATLVSYAAGALPEALAVVVATHLGTCKACREQLQRAEAIGGRLMEQQNPENDVAKLAQLRAAMLDELDDASPILLPKDSETNGAQAVDDADRLPVPLHPYFGQSYSALHWRWVAPGVRFLRATGVQGATLIMLKIAPGKSMPVHSHGGSEITQILQGAYDDSLGHYATGDVADLDREVEHQPITSPGVPCICVAALDAPLRFPGWLARKLQPLIGL